MKLRNALMTGLVAVALGGCVKETVKRSVEGEGLYVVHVFKGGVSKKKLDVRDYVSREVSYKLEDLCDTPVEWRDIKLNVYMDSGKALFDYNEYKGEFFGYIKDFFKENKINCEIVGSDNHFKEFNSRSEFGLEILDSSGELANRYYQLHTRCSDKTADRASEVLVLGYKGYAVPQRGVGLLNGGWEEFRSALENGDMTIDEVKEQYGKMYQGITAHEYMLKANAANAVHEVLHCMGLFHPESFSPNVVSKYVGETPNIMSYENMKIDGDNVLGYKLSDLQKKLVHSFVAGNNAYNAFRESGRDLDVYLLDIAYENNLSGKGILR